MITTTVVGSNRDGRMLERCKQLATYSDLKHRHGALIFKSGRVLGVGFNRQRNYNEGIPTQEYTVHAEMMATCQVTKHELFGSTIYIARINGSGKPMFSAPCEACDNMLFMYGVRRVVHT